MSSIQLLLTLHNNFTQSTLHFSSIPLTHFTPSLDHLLAVVVAIVFILLNRFCLRARTLTTCVCVSFEKERSSFKRIYYSMPIHTSALVCSRPKFKHKFYLFHTTFNIYRENSKTHLFYLTWAETFRHAHFSILNVCIFMHKMHNGKKWTDFSCKKYVNSVFSSFHVCECVCVTVSVHDLHTFFS